jgi:4-amino-4-deoxyprephenate dehydrogenase
MKKRGLKREPRIWNCVIVGGAGAVGAWFADEFGSALNHVSVIELRALGRRQFKSRDHVESDITKPTTEARAILRSADLAVLALPNGVAVDAIRSVTSCVREGTLLIDTLSVKTQLHKAMANWRGRGELLGINPMFSPELGSKGKTVLAVETIGGPKSRTFLKLLRRRVSHVKVCRDATEHDRMCAVLQASTHAALLAFAVMVTRSDFDLTELISSSPPPFRLLLMAAARMATSPLDAYWDIQSANPFASKARSELVSALNSVSWAAHGSERDRFAQLVHSIGAKLGYNKEPLAKLCRTLYEAMTSGTEGRKKGSRVLKERSMEPNRN